MDYSKDLHSGWNKFEGVFTNVLRGLSAIFSYGGSEAFNTVIDIVSNTGERIDSPYKPIPITRFDERLHDNPNFKAALQDFNKSVDILKKDSQSGIFGDIINAVESLLFWSGSGTQDRHKRNAYKKGEKLQKIVDEELAQVEHEQHEIAGYTRL